MKGQKKLRVIQILCIVSLLITIFSIQKTYAKYFEKIGTTYETKIKRWVVNVNDKIIHNEESLAQVMTPVLRENAHMNNNNTLVPGREGYFEFLVDYSKVDLAFKFEFDLEQLNTKTNIIEGEGNTITETQVDNHLEDFEIYGYSIIDVDTTTGQLTETITELETANNMAGLTQIIEPSTDVNNSDEKKRQIRILFRWNDDNADTEDEDSEAGMNNYEDTAYTGMENVDDLHELLKYNVKIKFTQKI